MRDVAVWENRWDGYKLLDSGNKQKLEQVGGMVIIRSEPRAWWQADLSQSEWDKAAAVYDREEHGEWVFQSGAAHESTVDFHELKAKIKLTKMSKHIGIFPEQSGQWDWIRKKIKDAKREINVLNLFGYTGMGTLAAASAGAKVTHVDGSKVAISWARENQEMSGLAQAPIRWILDDVVKFVNREIRRGKKYDAIIMDPPAYGRGPQGQVWKIEDDLMPLLESCKQLLSEDPLFIILTTYSIEASSLSLGNFLYDLMREHQGTIHSGELVLKNSTSEKLLPMSIFALWQK